MDRRHPIADFEAERYGEFFGSLVNDLEVRLLSGGACNSNYSVRTPGGDRFVCRIHSRGNPFAEKSIVELLESSIPAPEYLWIGDQVSVMSFIEGTHFRPTKHLVREAGRIIGRLRAISFGRRGEIQPGGGVVSFPGWETFEMGLFELLRKGSVRSWLGDDLLGALNGLLVRHAEILRSFDLCHNLVHGDFRPDNIMVSGDSITGVLDWEFAHSGCSYMDIGNLLRHIPADWEHDLSWGLREEGFELPENWRFRSLLVDLASHLEFLSSDRSDEFKRSCLGRVRSLVKKGIGQDAR